MINAKVAVRRPPWAFHGLENVGLCDMEKPRSPSSREDLRADAPADAGILEGGIVSMNPENGRLTYKERGFEAGNV